MIFKSIDDVLDAVSKSLRRAPSDGVWDYVEGAGWVKDCLGEGSEGEWFEYLVSQVRQLEELARRATGRGQKQSRELPPDLTTSAIVRIQAAEAARLDSVVQFRKTVLRGKPIKAKGLERWLRGREDGADLTDQVAGLGSEGVEPDGSIAAAEPAPSQTARRIRLKYVLNVPPVQTWGAVWFEKSSDLRRLHRVVSELRNMYGWKEEYAVPFNEQQFQKLGILRTCAD